MSSPCTLAAYLDFYSNIPDYSQLQHLSDSEFYNHLHSLKEKQQCFASKEVLDRPSSPSSCQSSKLANPNTCHASHPDICRSMSVLSLEGPPYACMDACPSNRRGTQKNKRNKHDVPLLSRIPLFDRIMAQQEERRRVIHEKNSRELRSLVQPFSFTKREEEMRGKVAAGSCLGQPHSVCHHVHHSGSTFRARPVPKRLFSEQVDDAIHQEHLFRALRKANRAEEMLKAARMPPSMEARKKPASKKKRHKGSGSDSSPEASPNDSACQSSLGVEARGGRRKRPDSASQLSVNKRSHSPYICSSLGVASKRIHPHKQRSSSATRSKNNLAFVLRAQNTRTRLENVLRTKLEEQEEERRARVKARLIRMTPAWRSLGYSTDEDLAVRLAQRRQEARQLGRSHRRLMDKIRTRVHHMPPLFQHPDRIHCCSGSDLQRRAKSEGRLCSATKHEFILPEKSRSFHMDDGAQISDYLDCGRGKSESGWSEL